MKICNSDPNLKKHSATSEPI